MILLSGATGMAGAHMALQLLKKGKKLRAIRLKESSFEGIKKVFAYYAKEQAQSLFEKIDWVEADVLDVISLEEAFGGIEEVYHLAAQVSFNPKSPETLYKTNVEGTSNILHLALKYKVKKFCHVSSVAVFPKNSNTPTKETYLLDTCKKNPYAYSKYLSEMEVWKAASEGLNTLIVNPSIILGAGFWEAGSGNLIKEVSQKGFFYTKGSLGYVEARDVASCCVELMEKNHFGEHFILNSQNLSFREFIGLIRSKLGLKPPRRINKTLLKGISLLLSLLAFFKKKENSLSLSVVNSLTCENLYSNKKIKETLDFEFMPIEKALDEHIKLYLEEEKIDKNS